MRSVLPLALALVLLACGVRAPETVAPTREPTEVDASFDTTWDAVIDWFAFQNIPIATIDRDSGIIVAEAQRVPSGSAHAWADCGYHRVVGVLRAEVADYNVLVRGDDDSATVRVTASWQNSEAACVTRGVWEHEAEQAIQERAENGRT